MTVKEAAKRWGVAAVTVSQACTGQKGYPPRFKEDECHKSEGTWLVTYSGMVRLYGVPKGEKD